MDIQFTPGKGISGRVGKENIEIVSVDKYADKGFTTVVLKASDTGIGINFLSVAAGAAGLLTPVWGGASPIISVPSLWGYWPHPFGLQKSRLCRD